MPQIHDVFIVGSGSGGSMAAYERDALKYIFLSLPGPSEKPSRLQRDETIAEAIANGKQPQIGVLMAQYDGRSKKPNAIPSITGRDGHPEPGYDEARFGLVDFLNLFVKLAEWGCDCRLFS